MKTIRLALCTFLLAAVAAPLAAQPKPAAGKPVEPARVAYVNSDLFIEEVTGIKKLVTVLKTLEGEFQPQQAEIVDLNSRLANLGKEINQLRANPAADPKVTAAKTAEAQQLQRTIKQKGEAGQAAYNKRTKELRQPVEAEIFGAFPGYIQDRGITVLLDSGRMGGALLAIKPELDMTADFIAYFNAKHP